MQGVRKGTSYHNSFSTYGGMGQLHVIKLWVIFLCFFCFLAPSGLSCGTWDLLLQRAGFSLVVTCWFFSSLAEARGLSSCGTWA